METIGIDTREMSENLMVGVGGFFLLFFIISPILGGVMARNVGRRWAFTFITGSMMITFSVLYVLLYHGLPGILPETVAADSIAVVSIAVAFGVAMAVGVYIRWWVADLGPSIFQREFEAIPEDQQLPFEQRRREKMDRRYKLTGRKKS